MKQIKDFSFSLVTSGLANYTEENAQPLIVKALFGAKTIKMLTPMAGVKSSETINILDTDAVFQTGGACSFTPSGTTSITQRVATVHKISVMESICPKDLEAKYTQNLLPAGSVYESIPFEQLYSELKAGLIAEQLERVSWQGDTTLGSAPLNKADGLLKKAGFVSSPLDGNGKATGVIWNNAVKVLGTVTTAVATTAVTGIGTSFITQGILAGDKISVNGTVGIVASVGSETSITLTANFGVLNTAQPATFIPQTSANFATPYTAFTTANAIAIMQSIANAVPVELLNKPDLVVFIGFDKFRTWQTALTTANLFNYVASGAESGSFEMFMPGTNIKVVAVPGLNGVNTILATVLSNTRFVTDLINEEEEFSIAYAVEAREVRYIAEFKVGFQFAFLNQIVNFTY